MNDRDENAQPDDRLSALVDGELDAQQVAALCEQWRDDPQTRQRWHSYQLIGDVLRSDDLASQSAHDSDFLTQLRDRLAAEPVVLAPAALESEAPAAVARAAPRRGGRALALGAVAAGVLAVVAGALTFTATPQAPAPDAEIAQAPNPVAPIAELEPTVASGELIRDARLDRYLAAHHQWTGGAMLGGHATYLRPPLDAVPAR